ncbi:hypothetical protein [Niveispirillum sp.]|uniref:hypothetical protein n=1 Tax=Niveispirillum sp. TaxID=1917217 RepID=UPI001B5C5724|nr:hypothetical protein [Niveispirillum sp.]MBP7337000.1 hypothetical protein [Niveispirillum sp.]
MSIARHIAALLIGFLISWGGIGGHGAHMAMAGQPGTASLSGMLSDGADTGMHADHHHDDHGAAHDGHGNKAGAKSLAPNCCLFACGLLTVLPGPGFEFSDAGWQALRLLVPTDDMMAGRSVSPLRRPPKQIV